jgi:homoserine dehydrogenase
MKLNLSFIGFGTVGKGLAELLLKKEAELKKRYNFEPKVVAISDKLKGSIYKSDGIDLKELLAIEVKTGRVDSYPAPSKGLNSLATIADTNAEVIIEVSYTNLQTGEPALTHVKTALANRKHVVTTNKGPSVFSLRGLEEFAEKNGVSFLYEGTVLSGTPVFSLLRDGLRGAKIEAIEGILNGTTNYILSQMEEGKSYEGALKDAQAKGYAEADPTGDVEAWDATGKIVILANKLLGGEMSVAEVARKGITSITPDDIGKAKSEGKRIKLVARAWKEEGEIKAKVSPERLPLSNLLANINGPTNALTLSTDVLGKVTIVGPGAGKLETGYALLNDLLEINKRLESRLSKKGRKDSP